MDESSVTQHFYIATGSSPADDRTRVLKHGPTFAVFDRYGDIETIGLKEQGIFCEGTRFLSQLEFYLGNARPLLLSSTIKADNSLFAVDLTNVDISRDGEVVLPRGTLHVLRTKFLWQGVCYEQFQLVNYGSLPVDIPFGLRFAADFADIFEVRGVTRERRGERLEDVVESDSVTLSYKGLDDVTRRTHLVVSPDPNGSRPLNFSLTRTSRPEPRSHSTSRFPVRSVPFPTGIPSHGKGHGTRQKPKSVKSGVTPAKFIPRATGSIAGSRVRNPMWK